MQTRRDFVKLAVAGLAGCAARWRAPAASIRASAG